MTTKQPRSGKGAQTRARLLDAAKAVFEEQGFLDARISDIADRAGLSHGSFYNYFDSKEQIFREVVSSIDEALSAPMRDVILADSDASPAERLQQALRLHFASYRDEAKLMGVIEHVVRYDPEVGAIRGQRHEAYREQVTESIRSLQVRGLAKPGLDAELAAAAIGGLTWRFAELWLAEGMIEADFDHTVEQVNKLLVNMLYAEPTTRRGSRSAPDG